MTDHPLHPQQRRTQREHDDGHVRPAAQADVEQNHDGEAHHGDEARTGLQFPIDFHVDALTQQEGDRGSVVRAKMPFEVHVGPFGGASRTLGLEFEARFFGVLRRVKHQGSVRQTVAANTEPFVGELDVLLLMSVLPHDFPTHLLQLRAVELHQQPRRGTGPPTLAPQRPFPGAVGEQFSVNRSFLVGGVVGFETAVEGKPAQEIVVRSLGHAGGGHVDVGLGDVGVVKLQTVERETIRPVRRRFGDHPQGRETRLGEDGGVVHETAEVVGQRDGAVGLMAGYVVHEWLKRRGERVFEYEVEFGVQLAQHRQVQNAARGVVDAAPRFASGDHLRGVNQRCVVG